MGLPGLGLIVRMRRGRGPLRCYEWEGISWTICSSLMLADDIMPSHAMSERGRAMKAQQNASCRYVPLPPRFTFWMPPLDPSLIETAALRAPVCSGLNVTRIWHCAPAARFAPHVVFAIAKSPAFVPVIWKLIAMGVVPWLIILTCIGALVCPTGVLGKFSVPGAILRKVPRPLSGTVCGLPGALSVTEIVPFSNPAAVGPNVTLIVQLAPGLRLLPQLFVWV